MADQEPKITDKASSLEFEKVKHSSLEYAVEKQGATYKEKAAAPYKESALPELTKGEAVKSVFKDKVNESVKDALGQGKEIAKGAAVGAAKGVGKAVLHSPRAALEVGAGIGLAEGHGEITDETAKTVDNIANGLATQADPRNLYREAKAVNSKLPAARARKRMARWDAKSKKALTKRKKLHKQLTRSKKHMKTLERAGFDDKTMLGRYLSRRYKKMQDNAFKAGQKVRRLKGADSNSFLGKLMVLRRKKAELTNVVFGWRGFLAIGGAAVCTLACITLISAFMSIAGGSSSSNNSGGGDAQAYLDQAQKFCDDDTIGYSQNTRCHNPNMDCSSFVYYCLIDSGYCTKDQLGSYPFTTGTMAPLLEKAGFERVNWDGKMDSLQAGDILINTTTHTEIYAGDGKNYGAHSDLDGVNGDSSGEEVSKGDYWNDNWDTVMRPTGGSAGSVAIPEEYGNGGFTVTLYTPKGVYKDNTDMEWSQGTQQAKMHLIWAQKGYYQYDDGIAVYQGRYLIACTTTYGKIGDKIDFTLSDGTVIKCIMADAKNPNDEGCNKYGHSNGQNVIEFEVNKDIYWQRGNPGTANWKSEWAGKRVCKSVNRGNVL